MNESLLPVECRKVPDCLGYQVDNYGNVFSCWKPTTNGPVMTDDWKQLKGGYDKDGYRKIILCVNGGRRYVRVHDLVLSVFVGPCPPGHVGAHDNGIRDDNRLSNLFWKTQKDNIADKKKHGTHQAGEKHPRCKLTAEKVREIRRRRLEGETLLSLASEFGIRPASVGNIASMRTWKDA